MYLLLTNVRKFTVISASSGIMNCQYFIIINSNRFSNCVITAPFLSYYITLPISLLFLWKIIYNCQVSLLFMSHVCSADGDQFSFRMGQQQSTREGPFKHPPESLYPDDKPPFTFHKRHGENISLGKAFWSTFF